MRLIQRETRLSTEATCQGLSPWAIRIITRKTLVNGYNETTSDDRSKTQLTSAAANSSTSSSASTSAGWSRSWGGWGCRSFSDRFPSLGNEVASENRSDAIDEIVYDQRRRFSCYSRPARRTLHLKGFREDSSLSTVYYLPNSQTVG